MRPILFHESARDTIRSFPREVRGRLGKLLLLLQNGDRLGMPLSRQMPAIAPGVAELRVHSQDGQYRTFYFLAGANSILVLHALDKKTQPTPLSEMMIDEN